MLPQKHRATDSRVAVIGSGISGLSAAWLLSRSRRVTLYEADHRPGGHANTYDVITPGGPVAVDTGFIVFNDRNYPELVSLFGHLGVSTQLSDMSFAASLDGGRFEYSGSGLKGFLGQRSNVLRPDFWRMIADILRFYRQAPSILIERNHDNETVGSFLERAGYSDSFINNHLLPMGAAIWSATAAQMREYPLHAFIMFFERHGLLSLVDRPRWRTVTGGSRTYVERLLEDFDGEVRLSTPVARVRRRDRGVEITDAKGGSDTFDDVVIATHADQALGMLEDASEDEHRLLSAFSYTANEAVLHRHPGLMPKRRSVWSSWNYVEAAGQSGAQELCVTYWMNRLQNLDPAHPLFVTLNPVFDVPEQDRITSFKYAHPLFDTKALAVQKQLWRLQGIRSTWFCGAYFGSGFHEDGIRSGLSAAEQLAGVSPPWRNVRPGRKEMAMPELVAAE
ncbi:Predicted NAD/FAD-binding protein [Nitratireductor aquibiodomus]|uniref:Predicted NAD/FAD-binding protein n=1 Tax=Nitratireductor aquibiodomus TaxID=204799 RepID=A0A1H4IQG4_9HYPH|nr:FAD-dependent oxidoreductase [Nitratireductor aquibiodomus]SEB35452.1 Predicted NAD/FAD-binding protein [Nitratireductor aquibiodomus]